MNPLLSIIVPVYNVEPYLKKCINSILDQPFTEFELILVDDDSMDNGGNICDDYAKKDIRVKVIHQENQGLSAARNAGLQNVKGEYITFVDSDDEIGKDTYSKNMAILLANKSIDVLEFPVYIYYGAAEQFLWKPEKTEIRGRDTIFKYWIENKGYTHFYAWNKIYKAGLFREIRFPIGKVFEDVYTIPLILDKASVYFASECGLYYYYYRTSSITHQLSYKSFYNLLDAHLIIWNRADKEKIERRSAIIYYLHIINILIDLLRAPEGNLTYNKYVIEQLNKFRISFKELMDLDIPDRIKWKNIPLVLSGLSVHCNIYVKLHKLIRIK